LAPQAFSAETRVAPALVYSSLVSPLPTPAFSSTRTVCPARTRAATPPGVMATRFS